MLADAHRLCHPHDLGHLVRLDVRPQPLRTPRQHNHLLKVTPNDLGVDQERRTQERKLIMNCIARSIMRYRPER